MENDNNRPKNLGKKGIARLTREMDIARIKEFGNREANSLKANEPTKIKHKGKNNDVAKSNMPSASPFYATKGATLIRNLTTDNIAENVDKKLVEKIAQKIENENTIPRRRYDVSLGSSCKEKIIRNLNARVRAKMTELTALAEDQSKKDDNDDFVPEALENVKMADVISQCDDVAKEKVKVSGENEAYSGGKPMPHCQITAKGRKPAFLVRNSGNFPAESDANDPKVPHEDVSIIPVSKSSKDFLVASSGKNCRQVGKTRRDKGTALSSARMRNPKAFTDVVVRNRSLSARSHPVVNANGGDKSSVTQKKFTKGDDDKWVSLAGNEVNAIKKYVNDDTGKTAENRGPVRQKKKTPTHTHKRNKSKDFQVRESPKVEEYVKRTEREVKEAQKTEDEKGLRSKTAGNELDGVPQERVTTPKMEESDDESVDVNNCAEVLGHAHGDEAAKTEAPGKGKKNKRTSSTGSGKHLKGTSPEDHVALTTKPPQKPRKTKVQKEKSKKESPSDFVKTEAVAGMMCKRCKAQEENDDSPECASRHYIQAPESHKRSVSVDSGVYIPEYLRHLPHFLRHVKESNEQIMAMVMNLYHEAAAIPSVARSRKERRATLEERLRNMADEDYHGFENVGLSFDDSELLRMQCELLKRNSSRRSRTAHPPSSLTSVPGGPPWRQGAKGHESLCTSKPKKGKDKSLLEVSQDWSHSHRNPRKSWDH